MQDTACWKFHLQARQITIPLGGLPLYQFNKIIGLPVKPAESSEGKNWGVCEVFAGIGISVRATVYIQEVSAPSTTPPGSGGSGEGDV